MVKPVEDTTSLGLEIDDDSTFNLDLDGYEGPLHLLLELARKQKVDLLQISILKLADQYLDFIEAIKSQRIDIAAEYLVMASWLALIKSRLLLPQSKSSNTGETNAEGQARALAFRLARLNAFREASKALFEGSLLNRDVFLFGQPRATKINRHSEFDATLYDVLAAFGDSQNRLSALEAHKVEKPAVLPLEEARDHLRQVTRDMEEWSELFALKPPLRHYVDSIPPEKSNRASLFSAALELVKDGEIDLRQTGTFEDIFVKGTKPDLQNTANIYVRL